MRRGPVSVGLMTNGGGLQVSQEQPRKAVFAKELGFAATSMLFALVGFILISGFTPAYLSALWGQNDAILEYAGAKGVQEMGLTNYNTVLGFPWGQDWSHFPALDPANRIEMFLLGLVWEPVTALNVLMIISFPLIAALMYLALRNLYVSRVLALIGGVSLSLVGYHFDYEHPLLSNYWVIPIGIVWLSFLLNVPTYLFARERTRLALGIGLLAGLMVGLNTPQYAFFLIILGGFALTFRWSSNEVLVRRGVRLLVYATPIAALAISLTITRLARQIPAVSPTAERTVEESYIWAGKLIALFTISGDSLLATNPVNTRLQDALTTTVWTGTIAMNNAVVVASTIFVVVFALMLLFRSSKQSSGWLSQATSETAPWSGLWIVGTLFFVTSGLGVMFASLITPQVRAWSRLGIVLAAIAITAAAIFVTHVLRAGRQPGTTGARLLPPLLLAGIAVLFIDSFLARSPIQADTLTKPALVDLVVIAEESLAADCSVLSVPTVAFPEAVPRGSMQAYDHLLAYLSSTQLRFSYGAIKGQLGSRWTDHLAVDPATKAEQARAAGFCAMLVDSQGLDASSASLKQYMDALGEPIATAQDRWYLFALGGDPNSAQDAEIFTRPEVNYGDDFAVESADTAGVVSRWTQSRESSLEVWNPDLVDSGLIMNLGMTAAQCANEQAVVILVDGVERESTAIAPGERREFLIPLRVPARSFSDVQIQTPFPGCLQEGESSAVGVRLEDASFTRASDPNGHVVVQSGYWDPEEDSEGGLWRWGNDSTGVLEVFSTDPNPRTTLFSAELQAPPCAQPQTATISVDGSVALRLPIAPGQPFAVDVPVPLDEFGEAIVEITTDFPGCSVEGDDRLLGVALKDPRVN